MAQPDGSARKPGGGGAPILRRLLVLLDVLAVAVAWTVALVFPWGGASAPALTMTLELLLVVVVCLAAIAAQRLYLARVCGVRAVEVARLGRASMVAFAGAYLGAEVLGVMVSTWRLVAGAVVGFALLAGARSMYDASLKTLRAKGRFSRPVVIIGSNDEAFHLYRLLETHPEIGFRISGVVGGKDRVERWGDGVSWLGDVETAHAAVRACGATGVVIAVTAVEPEELNRLSRELIAYGVHVHLSSGLRGIAHQRLRSLPLACEPLFYLEPATTLLRSQLVVKRVVDLVVSSLALLMSTPVLLVAAIAIKLQDGGPILFRQERVGRHGKPFEMLKLRTMTPDAECRLAEVQSRNQRNRGPLFKLDVDPRRTRVGRCLEILSIDELPQLINVLRGAMSLVGPRPALAQETVQFDHQLLDRLRVTPGLTGLWQVEARDNPAFDAYHRLDRFYLENWSVTLDLAILLATLLTLLVRPFRGAANTTAALATAAPPGSSQG